MSAFTTLAAAGFLPDLLPIVPPNAKISPHSKLKKGGKSPGKLTPEGCTGFPAWSQHVTTTDDLRTWETWADFGVGIQTRRVRGVDIDVTDPTLAEALGELALRIFGPAPCRVGMAPKRLYAYRCDTPGPKRWLTLTHRMSGEKHLVEVLGDGQQFVTRGVHEKTGKPYRWENGGLETIGYDGLMEITLGQIEQFLAEVAKLAGTLGYDADAVSGAGSSGDGKPIGDPDLRQGDPEVIREALEVIGNDFDYHEWITHSYAIKAALGGDDAHYDVYDEWSALSDKHDPETTRATWGYIHGSRLDADFIYDRARLAGWSGWVGVSGFDPWYPPDHPLNFTVAKWMALDLAEPDYLLGNVFSTTTRALIVGPTGRGKTHLGMAVAFSMAAGTDFLHWKAYRAAKRVMYVDGEMSARLARSRLREAIKRHGRPPENLIVINRHFFPAMPPLNTKDGQQFIDDLIAKAGGVDFIIFDNIQSLVGGVMKEEESWTAVQPWTHTLTNRAIGQLWLHHTGHDESHSYGTKTREWQMDAYALMKPRNDQNDVLIDFDLEFKKARECTPQNRTDFATARIWIDAGDKWRSSVARGAPKKQTSPMAGKFLQALGAAMAAHGKTGGPFDGAPRAATRAQWKEAAIQAGLIDKDATPNQKRAKLYKYQAELIEAEILTVKDEWVWHKADVFAETATSQSVSDIFGGAQ